MRKIKALIVDGKVFKPELTLAGPHTRAKVGKLRCIFFSRQQLNFHLNTFWPSKKCKK